MRLLLIIILTANVNLTFGQFFEGLYKSTDDSYRKNFFIRIQDEMIILYGWESVPTIDKDTLYYRAETKLRDTLRVTFNDFHFSKTSMTVDNVDDFHSEKDVSLPNFLLHRYVFVTKYDKETMEVGMIKDAYPGSRFDEFVFVRVK